MGFDTTLFLELCSGIDLDRSAGRTFRRAMCHDTHALGLAIDGRRSLDAVGVIVAHLLGYNFNMDQDTGS